ncbi:hypothetical protein [Flavobacterium sp.]|uniref:hypothetical protein n=1 Tax=Flavobacterium sp. TaxID=239 RepID=UPI003752EF2A
MKYYHLSPPENKDSILSNGLISTENQIFLFTNLEQAIHIATNQIFIYEYSIFEVSKEGITGKLLNDNVGEFGAKYQWILEQEYVEAKFIKFIKDESHNYIDIAIESDAIRYRALGFSEAQIIQLMCYCPNKLERYNEVHGTNFTLLVANESRLK